jgi:hypothetical protein
MGYFDGLTFDEDEKGNILYYPFSIYGSGYLITKEEQDKIKRNRKIFYNLLLTLFIFFRRHDMVILLGLIVMYPIYGALISEIIKDC